jgi:site-specific recombinase XerD
VRPPFVGRLSLSEKLSQNLGNSLTAFLNDPLTVAEVLLEQRRVSQSRYVFRRENGEKLNKNKIRRTFEKAIREAGIDSTDFKILRHTYASHLVMKGVDIRTVQKLLGHHSIKMTEKYSHLVPDHLQSVANHPDFEKREEIFRHKLGTNRISLIPASCCHSKASPSGRF